MFRRDAGGKNDPPNNVDDNADVQDEQDAGEGDNEGDAMTPGGPKVHMPQKPAPIGRVFLV